MAKKQAEKKTVAKKATPKKKEAVKLDPKKLYKFVVSKDSKHVSKGTYDVTGSMAQILIDKGLGSIK